MSANSIQKRRIRLYRCILLMRTVAVPLVSAVLGALAVAGTTYFVSQNLLIKEQRVAQAADAYADYLSYVSEKAVRLAFESKGQATNDVDIALTEIEQKLVAAKTRIGIFGSQEVVVKLGAFSDTGGDLFSEQGCIEFTFALIAMRKHLTGEMPNEMFINSMKKTVYDNTDDC